jgi:ABC-type transport system involved in cytochrome c biogenesis ATPase subunit
MPTIRWAKRTLLRLLAGIIYPQAGHLTTPAHKRCVLLDRVPVRTSTTHDMAHWTGGWP